MLMVCGFRVVWACGVWLRKLVVSTLVRSLFSPWWARGGVFWVALYMYQLESRDRTNVDTTLEVTGLRLEIRRLKSWDGGDQITGYVGLCNCDEGGQKSDGEKLHVYDLDQKGIAG